VSSQEKERSVGSMACLALTTGAAGVLGMQYDGDTFSWMRQGGYMQGPGRLFLGILLSFFVAGCQILTMADAIQDVGPDEPANSHESSDLLQCEADDSGLGLEVCWTSSLQPDDSILIRLALHESADASLGWSIGNETGQISAGQLELGEVESFAIDMEWADLPHPTPEQFFYLYAMSPGHLAYARLLAVRREMPAVLTPTPTLSCGFAQFVVRTPLLVTIEYPEEQIQIELANEGVLRCGDVDWNLLQPSIQQDAIDCTPEEGLLSGAAGYEADAETVEVTCSVDWDSIPAGEERAFFLAIYAFPRMNGVNTAHLLQVRATRP